MRTFHTQTMFKKEYGYWNISDFPSHSCTNGYSGGKSDSLTIERSVTSLVICCTVVLKGL